MCSSAQQVEDEHRVLFDCPTYTMIAPFELVMLIFFSMLARYLTFLTVVKQMHVLDSLGTVFP